MSCPKCGSETILLFSSYVCKAECDLKTGGVATGTWGEMPKTLYSYSVGVGEHNYMDGYAVALKHSSILSLGMRNIRKITIKSGSYKLVPHANPDYLGYLSVIADCSRDFNAIVEDV